MERKSTEIERHLREMQGRLEEEERKPGQMEERLREMEERCRVADRTVNTLQYQLEQSHAQISSSSFEPHLRGNLLPLQN